MSGYTSVVDDPEKHFLGNLLDDDTSHTSPLLNGGSSSSPGAIPPVSVISGVGPISTSSLLRSYWPEPPPPYSPPIQVSWGSGDFGASVKQNPFEYLPNVNSRSSTYIAQPQIHHHHHNLHHHSHTHNVVENHHHYPVTALKTPPLSYAINKLSEFSPTQDGVFRTNENLRIQNNEKLDKPRRNLEEQHYCALSAPLNKPPLSYRDVAARNDQGVSSDSGSVQQNKKSLVQSDLEIRKCTKTHDIIIPGRSNSTRASRGCLLFEFDTSFVIILHLGDCHIKSEHRINFQKITRKKVMAKKEKIALCQSASLSLVEQSAAVDAPTKYEVLKILTSKTAKATNTENLTHERGILLGLVVHNKFYDCYLELIRATMVNNGRSRSNSLSSGIENGTVIDVVARPKRTMDIKEKKKQTVLTNTVSQIQHKRRTVRKSDEFGWIEKGVIAISLVPNWIEFVFKWILSIVMDVCLQVYDVASSSVAYLSELMHSFLRRFLLSINSTAILLISSVRHFDVQRLLRFREPERLVWGLAENIVLPTTGGEALERFLYSPRCQDAYSALGLKASCTEEDVRRHYKRLSALLNPVKNILEGAEEACDMITKAYQALSTPDARKAYNLSRFHPRKNDLHHEIRDMWNKVRVRIEEARSFMYCDCGRRHPRIALDIRQSEARYCRRCKTRHAAKTNDIWVETRLCGLLWVYFTCCDGVVYDITDWATCEINYLKHVRPNSHTVQYRLITPSTSTSGKSAADATHKKQNEKLRNITEAAESRVDWGRSGHAQVSYLPLEPRSEDRSRRAANRRQKRWR
ncbi:DnaJ domain protein [Dictyocaulus viviparus]|uniref:DnaJ domain protein n=1 Tax=Dictyocaulus viviparus TaxID=29172 RepID=A0A0D8XTH5_DICVI|nr:DnaJ domain protein [Dictyocaulus viviparus]